LSKGNFHAAELKCEPAYSVGVIAALLAAKQLRRVGENKYQAELAKWN
jgi:hypothetical protein